jgi:hypothetical protein
MSLASIRAATVAAAVIIVVALVVAASRGNGPGPASAPGATPAQAGRAPSAPAGLGETRFWKLIADTRSAAGNDTGRQAELLTTRLEQLSPQGIAEFTRIRRSLDRRAYTWSLLGAAQMIEDGCSDDCFHDFRAYLISLGQGPYEQAIVNPDSLASVAEDRETGGWEDAFAPEDESDLSGEPRGTPFNEDDHAGLARRYPRLAARFH